MQNGDIKLVANLEYRTRLFGNLNGAIFLDAGNVWNLKQVLFETDEDDEEEVKFMADIFNVLFANTQFKPAKILKQAALGTGIGLRYDLGFLVIRVDWGLALHCPYDTGSKGYFNVRRFRDAQTLHFAIGYPF